MKTNRNKTLNDNRLAIAGVQKHFAHLCPCVLPVLAASARQSFRRQT